MTIKVNNTQKQSVEIFVKNAHQEIDVTNISEQKIDITDQNRSQDINVKNAVEQNVGIEQDVIIVPVYKDAPLYEGVYEVIPAFEEQSLPTTKKFLERDVRIEKIPVTRVSNTSGGNTVIIG